MKKLLALLLCVMLFVSIVPTAFALDSLTTETAMMSLYEKTYAPYNGLMAAYGNLGGAHAASALIGSCDALAKAINAEAILEALRNSEHYEDYEYGISALGLAITLQYEKGDILNLLMGTGVYHPLSYYGLLADDEYSEAAAYYMYGYRDLLGMGLIANSELSGDTILDDAEAEVARIEEAVTNGTALYLGQLP